jgi:hypothetical protein
MCKGDLSPDFINFGWKNATNVTMSDSEGQTVPTATEEDASKKNTVLPTYAQITAPIERS